MAKVRKQLAAKLPKLPHGRPSKQLRRLAQQHARQKQKVRDLFTHRYLFVRRRLSQSERATLQHTPHLRWVQVSRAACRSCGRCVRHLHHRQVRVMEEVYRLPAPGPQARVFDRRCRTETALAKLARLRQRVQRFKAVGKTLQTLFTANVEKALMFLDDKLLAATSNAVERGNRRHRKMQKTVYRVRTQAHITARIALDMFRDAQSSGRTGALDHLHHARAGPAPTTAL